jgi:glycosyltransferase involved in cell wall biosynthesis
VVPLRQSILHLITSLSTGGAEMMLYKLLSAIDRNYFNPIIVSLMDQDTLGKDIEHLGISVYAVGMIRGLPTPFSCWRLMRLVHRLRPDLIQGWMYHGNLAASMVSGFVPGHIPVLWTIRHTPYALRDEKWLTAALIRLGAPLSSHPARIIYNAQVSSYRHKTLGYTSDNQWVIPNGFDCDQFKSSDIARLNLRKSLGLAEETLLIGLIGRYHPMKGHETFIYAAERLAVRRPGIHFVLAGRDVDENNTTLMKMIQRARLAGRVHLLGERTDIPEVTAGLDIASSSSSWGEAFPNVVGEAMACGVPCVVTDVGDSARVVGNTGLVVPPRDADALAKSWETLIELEPERRAQLGQAARQRVIEHFSLPNIARQYEEVYREVLGCA